MIPPLGYLQRPATRLITPEEAGQPVSMTIFNRQLVVAFQYGVWLLHHNGEWEQIVEVARAPT